MKVRVRTLLVVLGLGAAAIAWPLSRDVAPPVAPPAPETPAATSEPMRRAAHAVLALAMLAQQAPAEPGQDPLGWTTARLARHYLISRPRGFRDDCSGFVSAVFTAAGVPMDHVVATLWERAETLDALHWGAPRLGDLVFFDDTWDRNRNGQWDDPLTHVGLVIDVEPDGTVLFAHAGTRAGRTVGYLNLDQPYTDRDATGARKNVWLREPAAYDPPGVGYLASDLWAGWARVDPDDDWMP